MTSIIKTYFRTWWIPILTLIGILTLTVFGLLNGSRLVFKLYPYLTIIICTSIIISFLIILFSKKWYLAIAQLFLGAFTILTFYIMFYPSDILFSNLNVPSDIKYQIPIELQTRNSVDSIFSLNENNRQLIIANYGQPGMYKSFIFINPKENGTIFLKAFEEVGNIELSADRLREKTEINVRKNDSKTYSQEFTIYEGVWGSKYVARFELWFVSDNKQKEYKLSEELYLIEGWIR